MPNTLRQRHPYRLKKVRSWRRKGNAAKGFHPQIGFGDVRYSVPVLETLRHKTLVVLRQAKPKEDLIEVGHAIGLVRCQNGAGGP